MKKLISLIFSAAMIAAMCIAGSTTAFAAAAGSGTEADPYVISTLDEFYTALGSLPANNIEGTPTYFRFDGDIISECSLYFDNGRNIVFDLNGHTLETVYLSLVDSKLVIKNGTLESADGELSAMPALNSLRSVLTAKGVTFRGGSGIASGVKGENGLVIDGSEFQIEGCTIISGNSYNDAEYLSALHIANSSGSISDTKLIRGSGLPISNSPALFIVNSNVTDGDGNPLSSSAMNEDVVIIPPSAFAPITTNGGSRNYRVKATYRAGASADTVYCVNIAWGSMEFTYTDASEGTWNPETHGFEDIAAAAWSCDADANKITVTNHSNIAIDAALSYTSEADYSAISGSFTDAEGNETITKLQLATALNTTVENAPKAEAFLKLDGTLSESTSATKIGSVTVTISNRN